MSFILSDCATTLCGYIFALLYARLVSLDTETASIRVLGVVGVVGHQVCIFEYLDSKVLGWTRSEFDYGVHFNVKISTL